MTEQFTFSVENRDYSKYEFINNDTGFNEELEVNPIEKKIFNNDVINFGGTILKSKLRDKKYITGILNIKSKQVYGRVKSGGILYKCIPYDNKLPPYLIAYKSKEKDFQKNRENLFVLFEYHSWDEKHPRGQIIDVIGKVSD